MGGVQACIVHESIAMPVQGEMSKFRDLEYCKIDLIAAKGIVFVKYAKSSSALLALESILANDCMVSLTRHIPHLPECCGSHGLYGYIDGTAVRLAGRKGVLTLGVCYELAMYRYKMQASRKPLSTDNWRQA